MISPGVITFTDYEYTYISNFCFYFYIYSTILEPDIWSVLVLRQFRSSFELYYSLGYHNTFHQFIIE